MSPREWLQKQRERLQNAGLGQQALDLLAKDSTDNVVYLEPPARRTDYTPALIAAAAIVIAALISRRR
jgi:hypothetical protein